MENQTEQSALHAGENASSSNPLSTSGKGIVINTLSAKEEQRWSETATLPQQARLPYLAPTIEVIEVKTERGYAGSGRGNNYGNGGRW